MTFHVMKLDRTSDPATCNKIFWSFPKVPTLYRIWTAASGLDRTTLQANFPKRSAVHSSALVSAALDITDRSWANRILGRK